MAENDHDDAERGAEQASKLDEFDQFSVLVERGVPSSVAISLITVWRAGDQATRQQMERAADELWTWIDVLAEKSLPPTRNGTRRQHWRPFSPEALWRETARGS